MMTSAPFATDVPSARTDASVPEWFSRAVGRAGHSSFVEIDGAPVHYLSWGLDGPGDRPAIVFVHGYRAHARWWDFIAPFFADDYRVVALDLSGMGDSGHRDHYDGMTFVRDILGVIRHAGLGASTIVGHSFGGARVLRACVEAPELASRLIVIDSYVRFGDAPVPGGAPPRRHAPPYPDLASALQRFRLMPAQPVVLPYVEDYVARQSLRQVDGGWQWKFDRGLPAIVLVPDEYKLLSRIEVPVDFVYGEGSCVVDDALARRVLASFRRGRGPVVIPDGYHHVMLSQPLALVAALRSLLA
ncbi:pimeloyl-ACP methyl ester carboxylesterase [Fulvimonas soli]|uniref:Pimeloyl-ACP methyl ester carboxylesterase n=2 Tax=Fulvimonas soli TaxID=155197 RepID=A0A316IFX7_9GAMM|nr:pimeloyl-ACP methyl ester carboxylesterase [Fulvimonas soli]